jgi:putative inorganic carbon (HCO3(-)) transporter
VTLAERAARLSPAAVVRTGIGVVVLALVGFAVTGAGTLPTIAIVLVGFAGATYLAVFTSPAWLISIGIALTMFSGNSEHLGLPIGPDRLLIAAGLAAMILRLPGYDPHRTITWRPLHAVLALVAAIGTVSAYAAGTLFEADGLFALLDVLGLVPFLVFTLAPLVFGTKRDRDALLTVLVISGLYLSVTGILEGVKLTDLVFPRYIVDPTIGIHSGRTRGPFVEAVAMGLALYGCAVAAAIASVTWASRRKVVLARVVCGLCLVATIFTLTRAVWLATVIATGMALLTSPRTRRVMVPIFVVGTIALVSALLFVPGFGERATERSNDERPIWDRRNTNRAAIEMVLDHPLAGIGWHTFEEKAPEYMTVSPNYPLTGVDIPVHNVPLSHAAELGLPTMVLWALGLLFAVGSAVLRPGPESLDPWRLGMVALFFHWLIVASFGPLTYAFPNLLLWAWAGVAALGHMSAPRTREPEPVREPVIVLP